MSDKRYPTRMHEVLGVEPEERFMYSAYGDRKFWLSESGLLYSAYDDDTSIPETQGRLVLFINNPERITRRPRLTEEQEAQLKALDTLGFKWLAKDENDEVAAFKGRPDKGRGQWQDGGEYIVLYPFMPTNCLMDLPDWSDPEPLDIVQVLRQNILEGKRMTDKQANDITKEQAIRILHPDTSIEAIDDYEEAGNYEHAYDTACLMAVTALRGPQPDPKTGLVPCGCGGKARVEESPFADDVDNFGWKIYTVGCTDCTIGFEGYFISNEDAQEHWNRAMGWLPPLLEANE